MSSKEETCSICLETIKEEDKFKTTCDHFFHRKCIIEWYDIKKSCPFCRNNLSLKVFTSFCTSDSIYLYIKYKRTSQVINKNFIGNLEKQLKVNNLKPCGFIKINPKELCLGINLSKFYENTDFIMPIHKMEYLDSSINITYYTRLAILNNKKEIELVQEKSINGLVYFQTTNECDYINKYLFTRLHLWISKILKFLDTYIEFNYSYSLEDYVIIYDLIIELIKFFKINIEETNLLCGITTEIICGIAISSILCVLKFKKAIVCLEDFNSRIGYLYEKKNLQNFIDFGKEYLKNNLSLQI